MKQISYYSIDLAAPCRVFHGKAKVTDVVAVNDVSITRVIDPPLDFYSIKGPGHIVVQNYEIDARAVVGGVRKFDGIAVRGKGGKAKDDEE